jgi:beta-1,4-mannosyltransferase
MGARIAGESAGNMPAPSTWRPARPLRIALSPLHSTENPFVGSFADALRGPHTELRDHRWRLSALIGVDVVLMHWPNEFMGRNSRRRAIPILLHMQAARVLGTRFVWIAHNLRPHDGVSDFPALTRIFLRSLDGVIYLSEASRRIAHDLYDIAPGTRELVTVHGRYRDATPASDRRVPMADRPVRLLHFGLVRPYKNIERLIDAVAAAHSAIELTILGKAADQAFARDLIARAALLPNVHLDLRPETIPQAELEGAIDASDAVVLPYRDILNSGSAIQALGRNRPVLVPGRGSMPELQALMGQEWVKLYDGDVTPDAIDRLIAELRADGRSSRADLTRLDWEPIGAGLRAFVHSLRRPRRSAVAAAQHRTVEG